MDPFGKQVGQCRIDRPLALDPAFADECGCDDLNREMAFATRVMTGMAAVLLAIVVHGKMAGSERLVEALCDFCGHRAGASV